MEPKRTIHSDDRMQERMHLNKKSLQKKVETAFEKGISSADTTGQLRRYMDRLFLSYINNNPAGQIRIYGREVYIFLNNGILKTVIPLPKNLYAAVDKAKKRISERN